MSTNDGQNGAEQGFNDSELLDIMQEIESLEREFASSDEEPKSGEDLSIAADEVKKTNLQDEIDQELAASPEVSEESTEPQEDSIEEDSFEELDQAEAEMEAESAHESEPEVEDNNVVSMTPKSVPAPAPSTHTSAPMSFSAEGSMNLNLEFTLGDAIASLHVHGQEGVTFEMEGVTLTLHPEHGAQVTMANGVKFTVPLSSPNAAKKAA